MPGTTRYSATFDRPYEEEERAGPAARRSRSQSWQANSGLDGRPYTPLVNSRPSPRSSSTDGGPSNVEHIPTRTVVKTAVKAHNNPFQFVKVGTCPLYKKAEEQLKKAKEVKKPDVLKEEEEWQSNLDSWKSRRRKMSEDVFRRQEEIRQLELEEQLPQTNQKKIKTFSEMVESRAHRGRTLSLCLMSSPLELQDWELEKNKHDSNGRFSGESEENSNVNSEDEEVGFKGTLQSTEQKMFPDASKRTNGEAHSANNSATSNSHNNGYSKFSEMETSHITQKEGLFIDSGLESISSSHRAGDTPDSGSDFSQDSGSSIDCDSPRVSGLTLNGVSLEEYNSKLFQKSFGLEMTVKLCLKSKNDDFGFAFCGGKTEGEFFIASVSDRSLAQSCGVRTDDQILAINGENVESKEHVEFVALLEKAKVKGCLEMLLRRPEKCTDIATQSHSVENDNEAQNGESVNVCIDRSDASNTKNLISAANCVKLENSSYADLVQEPNGLQQRSIESENEMYVDDFEELEKHAKSSFPSITQSEEKHLVNTQPQENGFHSSLKSAADPLTAEDSLSVNEKKSEHTNLLNDMKIKDEIKVLDEKSVALNAPKIKPEPVCLNEKMKPLVNQKKKSKTSKKVMNSKKSGENSDQKKNLIFNSKEVNNGNMNEDSLNIIFQSPNEMVKNSTHPLNIDKTNSLCSNEQTAQLTLKDDIPPIEKIAEEMEKMILEQLEEEERAKEMAAEVQAKSSSESTEHFLTAPPRLAEPPKEKPPPPPSTPADGQKASSLKRVNSTKRIKKEIHKRRSNFLGIENADENVVSDETSIPPPPALEEILKAEMELDRESRRKLENATSERLILEERDIIEKEREIIECLETEERQKNLVNNSEDFKDHRSTFVEHCDITCEEDRIQILKEERKRMEEERVLNEEQRLMLTEEKQLREREEYIRKQEADHCSPAELSTSLLSVPANLSNSPKSPNASSLSAENMPNISFSATSGEGGKILSNSAPQLTDQKGNGNEEKSNMPAKPVVPPKPLKKKEAIRKERERLRQEQEALQREREEHRRKLMIEQEELMNSHQKPHALDAPISRLGPLPPIIKPTYNPQLTTSHSIQLSTSGKNATFTSRSHHGAQNGNNGESICHIPNKSNKAILPCGKAIQNETWGQQKMPSVRKQNQDSLTESRYNQNHWLIQEAEMRRISEFEERQRNTRLPYSQTHLAEDDVCSAAARISNLSQSQQLNCPVQDKTWHYGHGNVAVKKYPPAISTEKPVAMYPGENVLRPPSKPSRVVPIERPEQMLSVSGRKRCSHCSEELGRGAAMIIESLQLYYHIHCFQCCVCQARLGNGSCGTDVRVRNNKLHCHNCYSNDEAGLKFSQV